MQFDRHFILRKLHSLSGVIPLTLFLFEHFYTNSKAMFGAEAFNQAVEHLHHIPYLIPIGEFLILFFPLAFHAIYGMIIVSEGSVNAQYYPKARNFLYLMQRITGIVLVVFLVYHIYNTRLQAIVGEGFPDYAYMAHYMQTAGVKVIYIIGVLAAVFHLANGLWSFSITWGLVTTPQGQRNMFYACIGLFLAMTAVGVRLVFIFDPALA